METLSTDAPITPLRQRMQQGMLMRGLGLQTQQDYVRHVRRFAAFLRRFLIRRPLLTQRFKPPNSCLSAMTLNVILRGVLFCS